MRQRASEDSSSWGRFRLIRKGLTATHARAVCIQGLMELLDCLCQIEPISLHLAEELRQLNHLILDWHRVLDHTIDPSVDIAIFWWLTSNVELIYSPRELLGIPHCLLVFVPVKTGISEKFGKRGLGGKVDIHIH